MFEQLMWTDYILIGIIVGSSILSIARGFLRELISVLTWGIAIFVAFNYSEEIGDLINKAAGKGTVSPAIAMSGTFMVLIILLTKLGGRIARKFKHEDSGIFDRLFGTIFGFARGCLIVIVIISLALFSPFVKGDKWLKTSFTAKVKPASDILNSYIPDNIEIMIKDQIEGLDESAVVQQTKKLLNALFGLELEIKKTEEEQKKEEDQKQDIDQKQEQLNEKIEAGTDQVSPNVEEAPKAAPNPLFKEAVKKSSKQDVRQILLHKQKEIERQRKLEEERIKLKLKQEQEKKKQSEGTGTK